MDDIEIQLLDGTRRQVQTYYNEQGLAIIKSVEGLGFQIVHIATGAKVGTPFWALHHATLAANHLQGLGNWISIQDNPDGWMDDMKQAVPEICQDVTLNPSKYI